MESAPVLLVAALGFFAGGIVKGVTGMGLPLVAVPIVALVLDMKGVLPMMTASFVLTNIWQVAETGSVLRVGIRFWAMLVAIILGTWAGIALIAVADPRLVEAVLGATIILFVASSLSRWQPAVSAAVERWMSPVMGLATGVLGGLTGIFGPPLAIYFVALQLDRESFVGAMGVMLLPASFVFGASLWSHGLLGGEEAVASLLAVIPAVLGLLAGSWIRRRTSVALFRRILLAVLFVIGVKHLASALL
jgi:uncharacterized protein